MHSVEITKLIKRLISFFYLVGFWHREEECAVSAKRQLIKSFYCIYHFIFTISLIVGAITSDSNDESIFLVQVAIIEFVLTIKLSILIWNQKSIRNLLNRICCFTLQFDDCYNVFTKKLNGFTKFVTVLLTASNVSCVCEAIVVPLLPKSERELFIKVGFPFDWRNNDWAYWMANLFILTELFLTLSAFLFSIIIWYLLFVCSLRYEVLGMELKKTGDSSEFGKVKMSEMEKRNSFLRQLSETIDRHGHLKKYEFFSEVKSLQRLDFEMNSIKQK